MSLEHGDKSLSHAVEDQSAKGRKERNNIKLILGLIAAALVAVAVYVGYQFLVVNPNNAKAQVAISQGQKYFQNGADSLALYGDGNGYIGFEEIIKKYSNTPTGNLANYYAAVSCLNLGKYAEAKAHAEKFKANDKEVQYLALGVIGDCLVNEGKTQDAISYYERAGKGLDNYSQSPIMYKKAGIAYLDLGNKEKAIESFKIIKNQYSQSPLVNEANKYIESISLTK